MSPRAEGPTWLTTRTLDSGVVGAGARLVLVVVAVGVVIEEEYRDLYRQKGLQIARRHV